MSDLVYLFVIENEELAKKLITDHIGNNEIIWMEVFPKEKTKEITELLDKIN
mgnify:FL=1